MACLSNVQNTILKIGYQNNSYPKIQIEQQNSLFPNFIFSAKFNKQDSLANNKWDQTKKKRIKMPWYKGKQLKKTNLPYQNKPTACLTGWLKRSIQYLSNTTQIRKHEN